MSVNNLHSLINGRWFINDQYGKALLPSLFPLLEGRSLPKSKRKAETFVSERGSASTVSAAAYSNGGNNQNDYVVVINLKDPIYKYDQECGPRGTKSKMRVISNYLADQFCKGIVLDIDSGGGQVSGTPEFYDFLKGAEKPIVAYTDGYMCSAAYYIGSAANYIVANKRAEKIGSIGVMVHFIDVTGMYEQAGAKVITEYATKSTEKNRAFEELLAGNPELYIKTELDPIADDFINDIKDVRQNVPEEVFKGGTWEAEEALSLNLVDEIGTLQTAIDKVFSLAQPSNNQNTNTMSKDRANLQAVLNLDAPLASTEENGSYLNEEQLDSIEAHIGTLETQASTAQTALADATAAHTTALEAATGSITTAEASVNAMLTAASLPVTGSLPEKLTALDAHLAEMNAKDGASHTVIKKGASVPNGPTTTVGGIDVSSALNN